MASFVNNQTGLTQHLFCLINPGLIKQKLTAQNPSVLFDQTWLVQAKTDEKLTSGGAALRNAKKSQDTPFYLPPSICRQGNYVLNMYQLPV